MFDFDFDMSIMGVAVGMWAVVSVMIWKLWGLGMEGQTTNKIIAIVIMLPIIFFIVQHVSNQG